MLSSMTGFGQASRSFAGYRVFIDIKSVNHKYGEVAIRVPKEWACFEDALKKTVLQTVRRGRVEVFVTAERDEGAVASVAVDWQLADGYMQAAEQLRQRYGFAEPLTLRELLQLPDVLQRKEQRAEPDERLEAELCACLQEAAERLADMRRREGAFLAQDLLSKLADLIRIHSDLSAFAPKVAEEHMAKLGSRIQALLQDQTSLDEQRLAAEVALFADRSNVDEELTRLQSHFQQCRLLLESAEPVGRKLDFLIQEMNREVNTIGSKANHIDISSRVIDMKAELEKMREQIQNIE